VIFARHTETLVGHGANLELPSGKAAETFDYEGEIVAVIGKSGRFISKGDALEHVIGYSIMNEGSVRGWMKHSVHAGKNFHASGSWGPWITTVDEIDDFSSLKLETHVNGKLMQSALAGEMIFSLSELIAYISNLLPLNPGDIIATGSPDGTGGSRNPAAFLNSGDCVEVFVDRIGTLKNHVEA
jgi:2-keto-4-pentenoate hydratase/2-oxohepta-3-ene-1,7-dioic acid hydratase in catechol pathway